MKDYLSDETKKELKKIRYFLFDIDKKEFINDCYYKRSIAEKMQKIYWEKFKIALMIITKNNGVIKNDL